MEEWQKNWSGFVDVLASMIEQGKSESEIADYFFDKSIRFTATISRLDFTSDYPGGVGLDIDIENRMLSPGGELSASFVVVRAKSEAVAQWDKCSIGDTVVVECKFPDDKSFTVATVLDGAYICLEIGFYKVRLESVNSNNV